MPIGEGRSAFDNLYSTCKRKTLYAKALIPSLHMFADARALFFASQRNRELKPAASVISWIVMKTCPGTYILTILVALLVAVLPARAMPGASGQSDFQYELSKMQPAEDHAGMHHSSHHEHDAVSDISDTGCDGNSVHGNDCCSATCGTMYIDAAKTVSSVVAPLRHILLTGSVSSDTNPLLMERPPRI